MCGICGFSGGSGYSQEKMTRLLVDNEARGSHATGIYSVGRKMIQKHNVPAKIFVKLFPLPTEETVLIGHTRHATQGSNIPKNAHPFRKGDVVGVHNGIIHNDDALGKKYDFVNVVDSEAIFEMINRKGIKGIKEISGCLAIAWTDKTKPNSLFLFREGNPLFVGLFDGGLYFSSLEFSLKAIGCTEVGSIKSGVVFEFVNGKVVDSTEVKVTASYGSYRGRNWDDDDAYGYWEGGRYKMGQRPATIGFQRQGDGHLNNSCSVSGRCEDPVWKWSPSNGGNWEIDREAIVRNATAFVNGNKAYNKTATGNAATYKDYTIGTETLAERKKKLDAAYREEGSVITAPTGETTISYPRSKVSVIIDGGKTSSAFTAPAAQRSMSVVKPEKEISDTTLDGEGKLAGGEQDSVEEILDALKDCYYYMKGRIDKGYKYDEEILLSERLRKILY